MDPCPRPLIGTGGRGSRRGLESLPIIPVNMKNSLARIAPSVTARRLVDDSLSPNTSAPAPARWAASTPSSSGTCSISPPGPS